MTKKGIFVSFVLMQYWQRISFKHYQPRQSGAFAFVEIKSLHQGLGYEAMGLSWYTGLSEALNQESSSVSSC